MNKFVVLIFSLSACYSSSTGQPDLNDDHHLSSSLIFSNSERKQEPAKAMHVLPFEHAPRARSASIDLDVKGRNCVFGFCEDLDGYPNDYFLSILNQTNEFDKLFNTVVPEIGERLPDEEENLCGATMNITYPKVGKNIEDKVRIIANVNLYKQGVVMETCRENSECQFSEGLPLGIKTVCKQRYTQLRLLALDDDNKPTLDVFPAPSCCVCMYKRT